MSIPDDVAKSYEEITRESIPILEFFGPATPTTAPSFADLEVSVRAALRADPSLATIDVAVYGSVAWLSGTAAEAAAAARAVALARKVDGVTEVRNEITIEP